MFFNADKCVVMHLGTKNLHHSYFIDGKLMKSTQCEKDIGVYIQPSLKPSVTIAESVKKANRVLGMSGEQNVGTAGTGGTAQQPIPSGSNSR